MTYGTDRTVIPVTIASGTALSAEVNTNGKKLVGIQMPAAWTAAGLSIQALVAQSGATPVFGEVVDAGGTNISISSSAAAANQYISLVHNINGYNSPLTGLGRIKIRSGTAALPVNQGADRVLYLVLVD